MSTSQQKVAFVTGGARGIGAAIVERFTADGTKVAFTYANGHDAASALVERLGKAGAEVIAIQADSSNEDAVVAAIAKTVEHFGGLDIVVNNAGGGTFAPLHEQADEEIRQMIDVNIWGTVLVTRHAIPHLGEGGRIVNIGSINGDRTPFPGGSIYAMTKGAITSFTRALSRELGPRGITVNNVQPGPVDTDANPADGPGAGFLVEHIAVGHYGHVDDISGMVAYLVSEQGKFITGATLNVDGGFSA